MTTTVHEKIQRIRAIKGYSQEYMASQLGLASAKAYSRYETGETKLDVPHLESIAKVLEMSVIELLSFDEKMVFNHCTQNHVLGSNNTYNEVSSKERDQLLQRIKHLEEEVLFLREELRSARQ